MAPKPTCGRDGTDLLEVTDLTRTYRHGAAAHVAIEGVSLSVAEGELVSIVGPSGCARSTLLRCVAGLLTPTAGQIELNGPLVERVPDRLSVEFQDYSRSLYPWLTVQDNVALPLRLPVNLPQPRDQTATREMPEFVKLRAEVSRLVPSHATAAALPSAS